MIKTLIRSRTWQDDLERPKLRKIYMEFGTWKRREPRMHPKFKFGDAKKNYLGFIKPNQYYVEEKLRKLREGGREIYTPIDVSIWRL